MSIQVSNIKIISRESQQIQQVPDITQINTPKTETQKKNNFSNNFIKNKKIPFNINVDIQNISDLISITDKYKFDNKFYYNINLKALHNIKDDLILLNNMIGLHNFKTSILDQLLYFLQNFHKGPKRNDNNQYNNQYQQQSTHTQAQQQQQQTNQQYIPPPVHQPSYLNYLYPPAPQPSLDVLTTNDEGDFKHTVIYGPPGTGKTEVAKILGKIYSKIGVLNNNIFKKVTKNDLVGQYLGQTAIKTKNVINQCLGGVLFIDEAYSLGSKDSIDIFSKECIDTLCEALSSHKNDLMVIIAGYEKELDENFFSVNQGLNSRFIWRYNI